MRSARTGLRLMRLTAAFVLLLTPAACLAANPTNTPPAVSGEAAAGELFRELFQLQAQLQATQAALDRNRQEAEATAARNAELLETRLRLLEQALVGERARELDSLERAQRLMLLLAAGFAGIGLLAIVLATYVQWRSMERLASFGARLQTLPALMPDTCAVGTGGNAAALVPFAPSDTTHSRMLAIVAELEKRLHELEHITRPATPTTPPSVTDAMASTPGNHPQEESARAGSAHKAAQINLLLGKGQTLLDLGRAGEALACFDEALRLNPRHPEALLKKGAALELARKPDEAIACYDRAIATDQSFTMAYLQKGGLCNRLERYEEALKCYEEALKTQAQVGRTE